MGRRLVYRCKGCADASQLTYDDVLVSQFREWRFGSNEFIFGNDVIQPDLYHSFHRTPKEIWRKAEECMKKCYTEKAKAYFRNVAEKYKDITIYSNQ